MFNSFELFTSVPSREGKASRHRFNGWSLDERNPEAIKAWIPIIEWFYQNYFRVQTDGWQHMPSEGKVLIVGSHNGGLASPDTSMFMYDWFRNFGYERPAYGLMHPLAWQSPVSAKLAAEVGAVIAHPKMAIAAFQRGAAVLVYPGGAQDMFRLHSQRDQINFAGRRGFIKLALREEVPIVPIISHGAHDTLIVIADIYEQIRQLNPRGFPQWLGPEIGVFPIYLGLPWGLAIGPLMNIPLPVQIHTRVCAPIVFEKYGRTAASDREYVDACDEQVRSQMQYELDSLIKSLQ
ncbi:lysophospholipid acyltransferase family protein [Lyngbya aestuarii]|uniref:lysophospholipid acyltransferase family protein n=1 Tax=Lyngbya aestuarii TaxID=118322 RepID=UPI00403DD67C